MAQMEIKIEGRMIDVETGHTLVTQWFNSTDAARTWKEGAQDETTRVRLIPRYDQHFFHDMDSPQAL